MKNPHPTQSKKSSKPDQTLIARAQIVCAAVSLVAFGSLSAHYAKGFFNMGRVFALQGQWENAARNFYQALRISPSEVEIMLGLGNVLVRQGMAEEAVLHLQKAVALKPEWADSHSALARALAAQGRTGEAEKHYREALRLLQSQKQTPLSE